MEVAVLIFLIILVALGYIQLPFFAIHDIVLFNLLGRSISLYDLLVFLIIVWVIELLPGALRVMAGVVLLLWLLAFFGIIAITGLPNILLIALVIGLAYHLFQGTRSV
ncbi:MAG: hypothetical protein ACEQSA_03860 [Weeksellaceae bacterium]